MLTVRSLLLLPPFTAVPFIPAAGSAVGADWSCILPPRSQPASAAADNAGCDFHRVYRRSRAFHRIQRMRGGGGGGGVMQLWLVAAGSGEGRMDGWSDGAMEEG